MLKYYKTTPDKFLRQWTNDGNQGIFYELKSCRKKYPANSH
jgi:hypothetical protein